MAKIGQFACIQNGIRDTSIHCGHRFNLELDADGNAPRTQISCAYPEAPRTDAYGLARGITHAGMFSVCCPSCGAPDAVQLGRISGRVGKTACESFCETATGGNCVCSCGGMNHGIRA